MDKNQKGLIQILIIPAAIVLVLALAAVGYFWLSQGKTALNPTQNIGSQNIAPINSAQDLNQVSSDLDSADAAQIDTQLNQLDSDTSSF